MLKISFLSQVQTEQITEPTKPSLPSPQSTVPRQPIIEITTRNQKSSGQNDSHNDEVFNVPQFIDHEQPVKVITRFSIVLLHKVHQESRNETKFITSYNFYHFINSSSL